MNKNTLTPLLVPAFLALCTPSLPAEIEYTTGNHYYRNDAEFGYVLKIGYGGTCSGTVAKGKHGRKTPIFSSVVVPTTTRRPT